MAQLHISECVHHGRPHAGGCLGLDNNQIGRIPVPPGATFPYDEEAEKAWESWRNGMAESGLIITEITDTEALLREAYLSARREGKNIGIMQTAARVRMLLRTLIAMPDKRVSRTAELLLQGFDDQMKDKGMNPDG
jgi:hypothetical protein